MKNKILVSIAGAVAFLDALWLRQTQPDAIALGNAVPPPPAPPAAEKEKASGNASAGASAEEVLKMRDSDEKEIRKMVATGLTHKQAEAALQHKKEFALRDAEHNKKLKERAAKK